MKKTILPVHIDGILYVLMAMGTALGFTLNTEAAKQFISPAVLFYLQSAGTVATAGAIALKSYRSRTYADSRSNVPIVAAEVTTLTDISPSPSLNQPPEKSHE